MKRILNSKPWMPDVALALYSAIVVRAILAVADVLLGSR